MKINLAKWKLFNELENIDYEFSEQQIKKAKMSKFCYPEEISSYMIKYFSLIFSWNVYQNKVYEKIISDNDPCNSKSKDFFDDSYHKEYASLIFKNIEKFKMSKAFIEITYFLDFSALESFCKAYIKNVLNESVCNDVNYNIAKVLNSLKIPFVFSDCSGKFEMNKYNENGKTNENDFFKSSIRTYTGLRNALFHLNKFFEYFDEEGKYPPNNNDSEHLIFKHKIKVTDCCYNLHKLVMYVGLKYAGFDSDIYNWSCWWKRTPA